MNHSRITCLLLAAGLSACQPISDQSDTSSVNDAISSGARMAQTALAEADYRRYFSARELAELKSIVDKPNVQQELVLDFHSDTVLANYAESLGIHDQDVVRERIARSTRKILINGLVDRVTANYEYPPENQLEDLAHEHYLRHKDAFRTPQGRRVAHILFKDQSDCSCDIPSIAERIEIVQEQIEGGADFAELAKEYSADSTAEDGGELPFLVHQDGKTVEPFELAVFDLGVPGDISEPFPTRFGVHLVKLLEIVPGKQRPFEEVREQIIASKKQALINSELEKLRSDAYPSLDSLDLERLNNVIRDLIEQRAPVQPAPEENNKEA